MTCPRCEYAEAYKAFQAEDRSWEIYRCPRCNFNWRSDEPLEVTNGKLYDPRFKMTESQIRGLGHLPPIPPLKKS